MTSKNLFRGTILLLLPVVAFGGGCWGRKFWRMPRETLKTSASVDSLLREQAVLNRRVHRMEMALKEQEEYSRGVNAQLKMDIEELKDRINALHQMLREGEAVSSYGEDRERLARHNAAPPAAAAGGVREEQGYHEPAGDSTMAGTYGGPSIETFPGATFRADSLRSEAVRIGAAADSVLTIMRETVPPPEEIQRQIYLDFSRSEYQLALEESGIFLSEYPLHPLGEEVRFIRGECFIEQGKHFDSIKEFSTILQTYPRGRRVPAALLRLAVSYNAIGERGMATEFVRRLIREYPYSEEAAVAGERFRELLEN